MAAHPRSYAELESRVLTAEGIEEVALRDGFFYGPGTWYNPDGTSATTRLASAKGLAASVPGILRRKCVPAPAENARENI